MLCVLNAYMYKTKTGITTSRICKNNSMKNIYHYVCVLCKRREFNFIHRIDSTITSSSRKHHSQCVEGLQKLIHLTTVVSAREYMNSKTNIAQFA